MADSNSTSRTCVVCAAPLPVRPAGKTGPASPCCSDGCKKVIRKAQSQRFYEANKAAVSERSRLWKLANPDKVRAKRLRREARRTDAERAARRARAIELRAASPERQANHRASSLRWYRSRRDTLIAVFRRRYWADPAKARAEAMRSYVRRKNANPAQFREVGRLRQMNRRARIFDAFVEPIDPLTVFERDCGICGICERPIGTAKWHVDHVIPLAAGGEHSYANVQLAHASCNQSKGAKLIRKAG